MIIVPEDVGALCIVVIDAVVDNVELESDTVLEITLETILDVCIKLLLDPAIGILPEDGLLETELKLALVEVNTVPVEM